VLALFCAVVIAAGCWFVVRVFEYGLLNVFFRNHHFKDDRQLTEDVAVELTRRALEAEAFDASSMKPQRYWRDNSSVFARNAFNPNHGYVLWGDRRYTFPHWDYSVRLEKNDSDVICRVYRPK
jgi:hypothetical protein